MTKRPTPARPPLAVSTAPLWRLDIGEAFAAAHAAGAEGVEVLVTAEEATQSPNALERLAERNDLPIVAIHAPQLLLTRRVYTTDPVVKIKRTVELARALDVPTIVLHPPYLWQVRYSLWLLHELTDALSGDRTTLTMENMYPVHMGERRVRFHRFGELDDLDRFPHLTLDTSHLAVAEEDIVAAYHQFADRVVHVHLSDNRGKGRDSHAPLGEGVLPVDDFVRALDPGRLRSIVLEVNPGPAAEDRGRLEEVLGGSVERVREHLPQATG